MAVSLNLMSNCGAHWRALLSVTYSSAVKWTNNRRSVDIARIKIVKKIEGADERSSSQPLSTCRLTCPILTFIALGI